jgi:hypothetical protein
MAVDRATCAPSAPRPAAPLRLAGPPGALFYLVVIVAILVAVDASTRKSLGMLLVGAPLWLVIAGVWFVRFVVALWDTRARMPVVQWARWLAIPLVLGLVFAAARTDALFRARFDLSRGALDAMAQEIEAGGSLERGWVGLYGVGRVERTGNGFWFVIDDSGLSRWGLAYSREGEPKESEDNFSPLWTGAWFEHLAGVWWTFVQSWD